MFNKKSRLLYPKQSILKLIILVLSVVIIFMIGINLRVKYSHRHLNINTVSFFYKRALSLYQQGSYLKEDRLSSAGQIDKEDYPPFLAYVTAAGYSLTQWMHRLTFVDFVAYTPLLIYCLLFFCGFYIMDKLFSLESAVAFAVLCSIMPVAVTATRIGYYTTEALGIFLTLLSLYWLIKSERKYYFTYLTILSATLLVLTWQLFIVFFVIVLGCLVINIRSIADMRRYLLIICLPLILGHIVSIHIIKIDYSPFYILREMYLGIIYSKSEDYAIALYRGKLKPLRFRVFLTNFGYFGAIFLPFGLIECLENIKKGQYYTFLFGFSVTFVLLCIYVKYRMIALPFLLVVCSLGGSYIYRAIAANFSKR